VSPRPEVPTLRVRLLGGFEVTFANEPVAVSRPGRRLVALIAVAHRGRPAGRDALAARAWPELSADRAAACLRSTLWRLPRPRGRRLLVADAASVRIADDVEVDLWEAEVRARGLADDAAAHREPDPRGAATGLEEDLLPDWDDEWLLVERESHRQRRLHALEQASCRLRQRGHFDAALSVALEAVRAEPLRESAHRRVVEVHLDEGNQAEALRQYDSYRRLIGTELGIAPSPAIRGLVAPLLGRPVDLR